MDKIFKENNIIYFIVDEDLGDAKSFLQGKGMSLRMFNGYYREGKIKINGQSSLENPKISIGDIISIDILEDDLIEGDEKELNILYEDDFILGVYKDADQSVHQSKLHRRNTLSNNIAFYFKKIGCKQKVRVINRLDKNTKGIVLVAKDQYMDSLICKQFENKEVTRKYLALVHGNLKDSGVINKPILKIEGQLKREESSRGQSALTKYKLIEDYENYSLVELDLVTGRGHQIRFHLSRIGHPVVGDELYGSWEQVAGGYFLYSNYLKFYHPIYGMEVEIGQDFRGEIENFLKGKSINS